jgi:hypothetical protein
VFGTSGKRGRLWQRWIGTLANGLFEAARVGVGRVKYLAYYISSSELRAFVRHSNNKDNLLARRMVALGLDPYKEALSDPAFVRHLQKLCTLCDNRECCLQDFTRSSTGSVSKSHEYWRDYCDNALALELLVGLQSRSKNALKSSRSTTTDMRD